VSAATCTFHTSQLPISSSQVAHLPPAPAEALEAAWTSGLR
jgi:hypothetical protein